MHTHKGRGHKRRVKIRIVRQDNNVSSAHASRICRRGKAVGKVEINRWVNKARDVK